MWGDIDCAMTDISRIRGPMADRAVDNPASITISTTMRPDGTRQVTFEGWPLYFFKMDMKPGDMTGQGAKDVWIASRRSADCEIPDSVPAEERLEYFFAHTAPHRKVGTTRRYDCMYDNARLLYKAYLAPAG